MIAYFARNRVAANLLMAAICVAGLVSALNRLTLEVFPNVEADVVNIRVAYPGSTPTESEEAIGVRIEEAIQDLEGIDRLLTNATEGSVTVTAEVLRGYNPRDLLDDIKNRVDSISTFPDDAERPVIEQPAASERVLNIVLSGPLTEKDLKKLGERVRDEITNLPGVTQVGLRGARPYEVAVEISEQTLQAYGLTFADVANAIRQSSIDLSAGRIRTKGGDVLLRTDAQAYVQEEFEEIVVLTQPGGTRLTLADIATVRDGFDENLMYSEFNGNRAVMVDVFRVGNQNVIDVANTVKAYIERSKTTLPEGVSLTVWNDWSETIRDRLNTLSGSLLWGGLLVFIILAMFLRFSVALFVALGVPVSFLGGLALMPVFGISLNLLSMFAFIMVLGIVVDDAIVTGENIFNHLRRRKGSSTEASIAGTKEVNVPVTFGVLTTMIAFVPLMMLPGRRGDFFSVIAVIVIIVLAFSLVQSKLVLPAHMSYLTHIGRKEEKLNFLQRFQRLFSDGLEWFIRKVYRRLLHVAIKYRYSTVSVFLVIFILMIGMLSTGRLKFFFFPRVESDSVTVRLDMPIGTPVEVTEGHIKQITAAAMTVQDDFNERFGEGTIRNLLMTVGGQPFGSRRGGSSGQSHRGEVILELAPGEVRNPEVSAYSVSQTWRSLVGIIPGGEVTYVFSRASGGAPIDVQLSGPDFGQLDTIAAAIKDHLRTYPGVVDIADSFEAGKDEIKLRLKPAATNLGLTSTDLARQVRQAFFGLEAQRIQRGRDDLRVMVRYPEEERQSLENLESMRIRTPDGRQVPFIEVADAEMGKSLPSIRRVDRNRTLNVTADIEEGEGNVEAVKASLSEEFLPQLLAAHPEVSFSLEGEAREQRESFESLRYGILLVLFAIYAMLAIVFRSYLQPFIIMLVIPFSVIGAIGFHIIRGDMLSIMSILGILALIGVVVNDSLVLVDYVNRRRKEGYILLRAVSKAGSARFRPILLTSLTTIGGLTPLLLEKSRQAQWLIPMAVSLAGGIAFATFLTLFLVPMFYLIFEDIGKGCRRLYAWWRK